MQILRQMEPPTESKALQALLTTGGRGIKKTSRTLRGSLWTISGDAERGWDHYLHKDLLDDRQ